MEALWRSGTCRRPARCWWISFWITFPEPRLYILNIGFAEVVSVLVRKKNGGIITVAQFGQALLEFEKEIIHSLGMLSFDNSVATDALALIINHSINATDSIILRVAMDIA